MQRFEIRIPGKTFVLGEYLALQGGPALLACTQPLFILSAKIKGHGLCQGIHPQSPAGRWIRENNALFRELDLEFVDPHSGAGGMGASTAQFAAVYILAQVASGRTLSHSLIETFKNLHRDYLSVAWDGEGLPPSGYDLLAQWSGGLASVRSHTLRAENFAWNFLDKGFFVVRTGHKVATHEHLRTLNLQSTEGLHQLVERALQALRVGQWSDFCASVNDYYQELKTRGWVAENSQRMVEEISRWPEVEAIKSCGAMGADTLLLFWDLKNRAALTQRLETQGYQVVSGTEDLAQGLEVRMNFSPYQEISHSSSGRISPQGEIHV